MKTCTLRYLEALDYKPMIAVVNDWWGGRKMADMLPKLFFTHFSQTSFVAEQGDGRIGFLCGFLSQSFSDQAYIHFVGVHPQYRGKGIGRALYERFFQSVKEAGRRKISCVTSPVNTASIAFHQRMGFSIENSGTAIDGLSVFKDYDGSGEDRVLFSKVLKP